MAVMIVSTSYHFSIDSPRCLDLYVKEGTDGELILSDVEDFSSCEIFTNIELLKALITVFDRTPKSPEKTVAKKK